MNTLTKCYRVLSALALLAVVAGLPIRFAYSAPISPSNTPLANIDRAPSNVALMLSVEFPTGDTASYANDKSNAANNVYSSATTYYGYFDSAKCYRYSTTNLYFSPISGSTCVSGDFKGNLLNWASMANIDQFRQIMTGGARYIDTTSTTVLRRAYNDTQSNTSTYFLNRTATTPDANVATQQTYRSAQLGDKMLIQSGTSVGVNALTATQMATQDCPTLVTTYKAANSNNNPSWTCYHVRVKVCDASVGLETNCIVYPGSAAKPQGLAQAYDQNMRFSALGFLNDGTKTRQGGVLRARMKSIGPTIPDPLLVSTINANGEWSSTTGVMTNNPDSADQAATASATNSGVLNYLNNFGYASGYKGYDPMAELYYETLRYLRKMTPTTQALSGSPYSSTLVDGFPVINFNNGTIPDPVSSACQQNFIVAIGDVNNHCDARIPGGSTVSGNDCNGSIPTDNPVSPATAVDFGAWTNTLATMEAAYRTANGLPAVSISKTDSPGRYAKWYMGGMAYWAHVNDIRPDRAAQRPSGKIQNVTTYLVDVLEPFNGGTPQTGSTVTPFYTAAKYGGFNRSLTSSPYDNPNNNLDSTNISWDKTNNGAPDNWYKGNDPVTLKTGLTDVFQSIVTASSLGEGAAPATSGVSLSTAKKIYYASYSLANGGIGSVKACGFTVPVNTCASTPDWDAAAWLDPKASNAYSTYQTNLTRQIITRSGGAGKAFSYANLTTAEKALMDINPVTKATDTPTLLGTDRVDYLRGDSSKEITKTGGIFRPRDTTKLGDIVGSGTVYVGAPNALYSGTLFSGYSDFITTNASRTPVNYVGANDGMLHAIHAATGKELFAYVPNYFLTADATTTAAKISTLTVGTYKHQFYVDATPMVGDVKVGSTWKTILVGGYGAGGKGFYALDVTDPSRYTTAMNAESNAASISKWEFSNADDADIGYTYNQPALSPVSGQALQYALIPDGSGGNQWAVIVGNGFGSSAGKAVLYFLNPDTGAVLYKVVVESALGDNGLATPFPASTAGNGVIDTVWAGDLKGNMWRVRWNSVTNAWTSSKAFAGVVTQPITSAPAAAAHPSVIGAWGVVFGTGQYIERTDYNTTTQQTLFGIADSFSTTPIVLADLVQQTVGTPTATDSSGDFYRTQSSNAVDFTTKKGWYFNMPTTNGERSTVNPVIPADTGVALMSSFTPATACLSATGYVNVLDAFTGGKFVDTSSGTAVTVPSWGGVGLGIPYFSTVVSSGSQATVKAGFTRDGSVVGTPKSEQSLNKSYISGSRFSWRQIR